MIASGNKIYLEEAGGFRDDARVPEHSIKSRPAYQRLARDPTGRRHILLADGPGVAAAGLAEGTRPEAFDERWTILANSVAMPDPEAGGADLAFRSQAHLLAALRRRLGEARMGLRLYAVGAEPFLWSVNALADDFGLGRLEIRLCAPAPGPRRVFCNHCRTITEGVKTNVFACAGCRAPLFVRDHFSRRLNAFAGVKADAEAPGDLPPILELYP
jgi:hypothetical protein